MVKKVFVGQVTEGVLTPTNPVLNTSLVSMAGLLVLWPIFRTELSKTKKF